MIFKKKKEKPVIEFSCEDWAIRKYAPVLPANQFIPQAYKDLTPGDRCPYDPDKKQGVRTAKTCPAVNQYLGTGYIIPAWCDMEVDFTNEGMGTFQTANPKYGFEHHTEYQFGNLLNSCFEFRTILKLNSPWHIITKPGYDLIWLPLWYHNKNYQAVPGMTCNKEIYVAEPINLGFHKPEKTEIKLGDPLVQIIPIKRENINATSVPFTESHHRRHIASWGLNYLSKMGWRNFFNPPAKFTLDRKGLDIDDE